LSDDLNVKRYGKFLNSKKKFRNLTFILSKFIAKFVPNKTVE